MKAIVCDTYAPVEALRWAEVRQPEPDAGEVQVEVHAAGLNFADTLKVQGRHQVKVPLPWTPGAEVGGIVSALGPGVTGLQVGQRVMAVPDDRAGGFAEFVVVRAARALPVPESVSLTEAAAIPAAYGTVLYALRQRARLAAGECVLVLGAAGGVGLAAVQVAVAMGARVIAGASTAAKRELAARHGAFHTIDYTQADWRHQVATAAGPGGVQVVFDPVGGNVFDEAVRAIGWGGRYLVVGFAEGRIPELKMNHPLVKGYDVLGIRYDVWRDRFWDEARDNLAQLLAWCAEGRVRPVVSRVMAMARAAEALTAIASRQVVGKIVLSTRSDHRPAGCTPTDPSTP